MLAAVISHCPATSKRENVLKYTRNYLPLVGTYDICGTNRLCLRKIQNHNKTKFWAYVSKKFKFILNSLSKNFQFLISEETFSPPTFPVEASGFSISSVTSALHSIKLSFALQEISNFPKLYPDPDIKRMGILIGNWPYDLTVLSTKYEVIYSNPFLSKMNGFMFLHN